MIDNKQNSKAYYIVLQKIRNKHPDWNKAHCHKVAHEITKTKIVKQEVVT